MRLIKIWEADPQLAFDLKNSFPAEESGFVNCTYGFSFEQFLQYQRDCIDHSEGRNLPEGFVPDTIFILEDDDGNYAGVFNLRHRLNAFLESGAGHIGYGIAPRFRRRGYATKGLALVLEEARAIGIEEAYLSVNKNNAGSLKAQLANGALIHHENETEYFTRIKL